jgi:cellulose biosynthesis protein BcsQ
LKTIAFFNNKGGVGKTSLVYHLAWMFADCSKKVLAVDLDPQANLTSMFLSEDRLVELWDGDAVNSIYECVLPLINREGDFQPCNIEAIGRIALLPGKLALSRFEDQLSENWPKCLAGDIGAFRVITAFYRIIAEAAKRISADVVLMDVGPNLGAINRSALIAADQVILPLAPDLFSLQGMKNLGPTLREWRKGWKKRLEERPDGMTFPLPDGEMQPSGYIIMQHSVREDRPVKAYQLWANRIPRFYREAVLDLPPVEGETIETDLNKLALLKHYRSLMPMAQDARKPIFHLTAADGAIGAHTYAVRDCYADFLKLAKRIAGNADLEMS